MRRGDAPESHAAEEADGDYHADEPDGVASALHDDWQADDVDSFQVEYVAAVDQCLILLSKSIIWDCLQQDL